MFFHNLIKLIKSFVDCFTSSLNQSCLRRRVKMTHPFCKQTYCELLLWMFLLAETDVSSLFDIIKGNFFYKTIKFRLYEKLYKNISFFSKNFTS